MHVRSSLAGGVIAAAALAGVAACGNQQASLTPVTHSSPASSAPSSSSAPPSTTRPAAPPRAPAATPSSTPPAAPPRQAPAPQPQPTHQFSNASAVVAQFYQDITDHNYAAAWALGGKNIGGSDYAGWVAGYSTTASISLGTENDFGSGQVQAVLYATQTDGTLKVYEGTYTVSNGVIVAADIRQIQ